MSLATYLPNLAGGVLIGLAAGVLRLVTGEIAGISGITRKVLRGPDRGWRIIFIGGLLLPALLVNVVLTTAAQRDTLTAGLVGTPLWLLAVSGLIVGLGTGIGNGCTSGHGICGLARFSWRSLVAVAVFMTVAALTVLVARHGIGGVGPWR